VPGCRRDTGRSSTGNGFQSALLQTLPHHIDDHPHDEGYRDDCQHALPPRYQQIRRQANGSGESVQERSSLIGSAPATGVRLVGIV
jgi:hypothetical protein